MAVIQFLTQDLATLTYAQVSRQQLYLKSH